MQALIVVSHGSKHLLANEQISALVKQINEHPANAYDVVAAAFLEFTQPSVDEVIDFCVQVGVKSIIVMPYFLAAGKHVKEDIPNLINASRRKYPQTSIKLVAHFGACSDMAGLIVDHVLHEAQNQ